MYVNLHKVRQPLHQKLPKEAKYKNLKQYPNKLIHVVTKFFYLLPS